MIKLDRENERLKEVYRAIGLHSSDGNAYGKRSKKFQQIESYLIQLVKAVGKLSKKRELILVDCACGKSYLSFVANYYLTEVLERKVRFVCIDYNAQVISASKEAARQLGYKNMTFICQDIFSVDFHVRPDIVYSLHACDTATDMAIAKGILDKAQYIMTVACCQHTMRKTLKKHPLGAITKHGVYKERLSDMVADSMRTLVLESIGYKVNIFDYVDTSETPKNVMVRAERIGQVSKIKVEEALMAYDALKQLFKTEPQLRTYIEKH